MVQITALKAYLLALSFLACTLAGTLAQDGVLGHLEAVRASYAERLKKDQEKARKGYLNALDKLHKELKNKKDAKGAREVEAERKRIRSLIDQGPFALLRETPASPSGSSAPSGSPDNHLSLTLSEAILDGGVQYQKENGLLRWRNQESAALWTAKDFKKGRYQLEIAYTTTERKPSGKLKISLDRPKKTFQPSLKPGRNRLEVGTFQFPGGDLKLRLGFTEIPHRTFRLRGIRLIPMD